MIRTGLNWFFFFFAILTPTHFNIMGYFRYIHDIKSLKVFKLYACINMHSNCTHYESESDFTHFLNPPEFPWILLNPRNKHHLIFSVHIKSVGNIMGHMIAWVRNCEACVKTESFECLGFTLRRTVASVEFYKQTIKQDN